MPDLLILKTGALGDVLRTTSILPGLARRHPGELVHWVTAPGAVDLVRHHPLVAAVTALEPGDASAVERVGRELGATAWTRVLSLDDEEPMCRLASAIAAPWRRPGVLSGAYVDERGARRYTPDVAPWFDMGLLSVHGKRRADELKVLNTESHAALYARMFGIEMGEPELPLPDAQRAFGLAFRARAIDLPRPWVGLNTGSGGRWESKKLDVERTVALASAIAAARQRRVGFVLLGGPEEAGRNRDVAHGLASAGVPHLDAGTDNALLDFAAIVDALDLLVTSDSLALHVAVARRVPVLAFFAPTSAAEIELYGRGEKVVSTAPDYCSYRKDADTSTLTVERLLAPALALLAAPRS